MNWIIVYLIGMYAILAILSWRNGIIEGIYEMCLLLFASLLWPLVIVIWITNFCYRIYKKIKKLWQH